MEGNIVVDGVLASCYSSADHDMIHTGMLSARWIPDMMEWIFGADNGLSSYVKITEEFARWSLPFSQYTT